MMRSSSRMRIRGLWGVLACSICVIRHVVAGDQRLLHLSIG
jgi:hypothetical protein